MKINYTKGELEKMLTAIKKQEHDELIKLHTPAIKQLEGRFFKSNNGYTPSERWTSYARVIKVNLGSIWENGDKVECDCIVQSFEIDSRGKINIGTKDTVYSSLLGREITEAEYNKAWNKLIDKINSLK